MHAHACARSQGRREARRDRDCDWTGRARARAPVQLSNRHTPMAPMISAQVQGPGHPFSLSFQEFVPCPDPEFLFD